LNRRVILANIGVCLWSRILFVEKIVFVTFNDLYWLFGLGFGGDIGGVTEKIKPS
jgi:hypothetical protein